MLVEEVPLFQGVIVEMLEDLVVEELLLVQEEQVIHLKLTLTKVMLEEMEVLVVKQVLQVVVVLQLLEVLQVVDQEVLEPEVQEHLIQF